MKVGHGSIGLEGDRGQMEYYVESGSSNCLAGPMGVEFSVLALRDYSVSAPRSPAPLLCPHRPPFFLRAIARRAGSSGTVLTRLLARRGSPFRTTPLKGARSAAPHPRERHRA